MEKQKLLTFKVMVLKKPKGNNFHTFARYRIGERIVGLELFVSVIETQYDPLCFSVPFEVISTAIELKEGKPFSLESGTIPPCTIFEIQSSLCKIVQ